MNSIYLVIFSVLSLSLVFSAQAKITLKKAGASAQSDLKLALEELAELRSSIASEKIPLLKTVTNLEEDVRKKQNQVDRLLRLRDNSVMDLNRLRDQVKELKDHNNYAASLLDEFVHNFETRIDFSETQLYEDATQEAQSIIDDSDATQADRFVKQIEVIDIAINRLENLIGGYTFEGLALVPNGEIIDGTFAAFGPSVYFSAKDASVQGISIIKVNTVEAAIAIPGQKFNQGIQDLVHNKEGQIPLDPTRGEALKIVEGNDTLFEHLAKGGSVGAVIIALGVACLFIGLFKAHEITGYKTPSRTDVQEVLTFIEAGKVSEAQKFASILPGVGGELLGTGVENYETKRGNLEEILYEKIISAQPGLERFLPFMALTAAAAPLLGLLGTVTGMIKTFNLITLFGTGDAKSLSSGISEALVTTELGLCVAIPSLILHGLLSRMAKQKIGDLEQVSVSFINGVSGLKNSEN
jgi:biopolymer transport protein ExbB